MTDLDALAPDSERLAGRIAELSEFHDSARPGWGREVFSEPYRASRDWVRRQMAGAGLEPVTDGAGNIIGRLPGRRPSEPPLVTGSHTDTVLQGGRFDGVVGVLSGIEAAQRLRETGTVLEHDLLVVDFFGEEANPYGISCFGSRAVAGALSAEDLDRRAGTGVSLGEAATRFGLDPQRVLEQAWSPSNVHAYVELHVEQGPLLERAGKSIGVVTAIAGIDRLLFRFAGAAGHAGTTPMADRHDALVSAASAVLTVERVGCGAPVHGVATSGYVEASPGSMAVISDQAQVWAEIRSVDAAWLQGARGRIVDEILAETRQRGVEMEVESFTDLALTPAAPEIQDVIGRGADRLGLSWQAVPSGAGHDAGHLAHLGPMGMIFVPSVDGKSHCPEEFTPAEDIAQGAHVLTATLLDLDRPL